MTSNRTGGSCVSPGGTQFASAASSNLGLLSFGAIDAHGSSFHIGERARITVFAILQTVDLCVRPECTLLTRSTGWIAGMPPFRTQFTNQLCSPLLRRFNIFPLDTTFTRQRSYNRSNLSSSADITTSLFGYAFGVTSGTLCTKSVGSSTR